MNVAIDVDLRNVHHEHYKLKVTFEICSFRQYKDISPPVISQGVIGVPEGKAGPVDLRTPGMIAGFKGDS